MKRMLALKTEIFVRSVEERILLTKHAGAARFAYNWALDKRKKLFDSNEGKARFTSHFEQRKEFHAIKRTEYPWIMETSKWVSDNAIDNVDVAFKNMKKMGSKKPRFKKKFKHDSFTIHEVVKVNSDVIRVPKFGTLKLKENIKPNGKVFSATFSRDAGDRWFVSFNVEREVALPYLVNSSVIGVDMGLKTFAITSEGEQIVSPRPLKKRMRMLKRRQRIISRRAIGGTNRKKAIVRVAKTHFKIKCIRKDFLNKTTTALAKTKSCIVLEDLNVKGMMKNHNLAGSISDSGWGEFKRQLVYKSEWYGSKVVFAPRFFASSKTCSDCGLVKKQLSLSKRVFRCERCGLLQDRDLNAAINLKNWYQNTLGSGEINACGDRRTDALFASVPVSEAGTFKTKDAFVLNRNKS